MTEYNDPIRIWIASRHIMTGLTLERPSLSEMANQLDSIFDEDNLDDRIIEVTTSLIKMARKKPSKRASDMMWDITARAIYLIVRDANFATLGDRSKAFTVICEPLDVADEFVRVTAYDTIEEYDETVAALLEAGQLFGGGRTLNDYH